MTALAAAGLLLAVGACTTPPGERPDVVWPDGEPTGPLDDNPWVQAASSAKLEVDVARATRDFTRPSLWETNDEMSFWGSYIGMKSDAENNEWKYPPGPTPMIPILVDEAPDGLSADVVACQATYVAWSIDASQPAPPIPPPGSLRKHSVVLDGDQRRVTDIGGISYEVALGEYGNDLMEDLLDHDAANGDCHLDDATFGYFDPLPDPNLKFRPEDIAWPDDPPSSQ